MKPDPFLLELETLLRTRPKAKDAPAREHQKALQRLHATALRRAMRTLRSAMRNAR